MLQVCKTDKDDYQRCRSSCRCHHHHYHRRVPCGPNVDLNIVVLLNVTLLVSCGHSFYLIKDTHIIRLPLEYTYK